MSPRVSIGMPVYNGVRHVATALDSLLAQTCGNFELIICDNASIDGTTAVCDWYARRDRRIRLGRVVKHHSAADNFNLALEKARAPLFMWAAHDDEWVPTFIEECAARLEDQSVVGCYSAYQPFDDAGNIGNPHTTECAFMDRRERWRHCLDNWSVHAAIYSVMRTEEARLTRGLLPFLSADLVFVAELALHGRIVSTSSVLHRKRMKVGATYNAPCSFHRWRVANEFMSSIREAELCAIDSFSLISDVWRSYAKYGVSIDMKTEIKALMRLRH